jgi:hypothetical protein
MAGAALKDLARPDPQHAVADLPAVQTTETLRPAHALQRRFALGFRPKLPQEIGHRQTGLELNTIHGHGASPLGRPGLGCAHPRLTP